MSSYEEGIQLYNISSPSTPSLVGYFDTYPQGGGNTGNWSNAYGGQWGCYPFHPSRTIFALDQLNGLFFLKTAAYTKTVSTVDVTEIKNETSAAIFPNPATDKLLVYGYQTAQNHVQLQISDMTGRIVLHKELPLNANGGTSVDLSALSNGIYFSTVISDGFSIATKKLVISR